jgi:hypothetical protein
MAHLHLLRTFKQTSLTTAAVGVGVLVLVPLLLPVAKTVAKASIKSGVKLYQNGQKTLAEVGELWQKLRLKILENKPSILKFLGINHCIW